MAKYSPEFKQEVRNFWSLNTPLKTYKQFSHVGRETLRSWCDPDFKKYRHDRDRKTWTAYYAKNKEKVIKNSIRHSKENAAAYKEYHRKRHLDRYETIIKPYFKSRKERGITQKLNKAWREANAEHLKRYRQKQFAQNKNKLYTQRKLRKQSDPGFKILENLRCYMSTCVKKAFTSRNQIPQFKAGHTIELIGCSLPELLEHLRKRYLPNMTDENYGEWHIDHIIPCSTFDLTDPAEQKKCFHYTNLQPLWAVDNFKKSDKLP